MGNSFAYRGSPPQMRHQTRQQHAGMLGMRKCARSGGGLQKIPIPHLLSALKADDVVRLASIRNGKKQHAASPQTNKKTPRDSVFQNSRRSHERTSDKKKKDQHPSHSTASPTTTPFFNASASLIISKRKRSESSTMQPRLRPSPHHLANRKQEQPDHLQPQLAKCTAGFSVLNFDEERHRR